MAFFSLWLISVRITPSRSMHIVADDKISFFSWLNLHTHTHHIFFIHSSMSGHGCFHVLTIINNATVKMGMHIFYEVSAFVFFRYIPRGGFTWLWQIGFYFFKDPLYWFSIVAAPIHIPTDSAKSFMS